MILAVLGYFWCAVFSLLAVLFFIETVKRVKAVDKTGSVVALLLTLSMGLLSVFCAWLAS